MALSLSTLAATPSATLPKSGSISHQLVYSELSRLERIFLSDGSCRPLLVSATFSCQLLFPSLETSFRSMQILALLSPPSQNNFLGSANLLELLKLEYSSCVRSEHLFLLPCEQLALAKIQILSLW